jgi:beta-aspartyl-peptidase (threonine type)
MKTHVLVIAMALLAAMTGCATRPAATAEQAPPPQTFTPSRWAIVIHGGAGVIPKDSPREEIASRQASLAKALSEGRNRLARGDSAVDTVEAVVRMLEDDANFNAGVGAAFNEQGKHELDASIMDGATLNAGAVAGVRTVKNPVSLARLVMTQTPHVLLMGDGAEEFATAMNVARVPNEHFSTPRRREMLDEVLRERAKTKSKSSIDDPRMDRVSDSAARSGRIAAATGTVGCVAFDTKGNLASATSTGGLTGKRFGRVGDTPIIGAGTYASNASCAVSCTGTGEQFIRHTVARDIAARMELKGETLEASARHLIFNVLKPDDGGIIAIDRNGTIVMLFNGEGMFRAASDSGGMSVVKIWE